ncbi:response regulator [Metasolibacillus meyeri]|uniref:response regulator n=1 Tax=Metasolibacillus meyeri TaxID=1071052 RepID=UPI000D324578|nr:response regulator transcription factor [Metasolibacillus meyeri]
MITILIADDQMLIREGLKTIIDLEDDMQVVALASNGEEAIALAKLHRPQLVMMDIQMPIMDGLLALKAIKEQLPNTFILILSTFLDEDYIVNGLVNGASGYLLKDMVTDKMLASIRDTVQGQLVLPSVVAVKLVGILSQASTIYNEKMELTQRELEIAKLIVVGKSNKEIAVDLYIAEGTVRNYVSNLYSKLEVIDRVQAIVKLKGYL